ncbi:MAG: hypothetical protein CRN43_08705 [Candidatus Nephrothrix sp. EaCA]|nr:MAG: hypothetical protein CRN43_08705 [Candidatus Nephrothrix sp. EaCA]
MKINRNNTTVLLILLLVSLQSCRQRNNKTETYDQYRTQKIEPRDSLFILHTVKEWGKKNWYTWENFSKMYKMTNEQVEYFIEGTFYSPNRKRILVWVGEKMPNATTIEIYNKDDPEVNKICPTGGDTIYTLSALIGDRDSINQIWKLYPFDQQQAICCASKKQAINILGKYYFGQMKTHQTYRIMPSGKRKGHKESEAYGYNLQDKDFWDKCWLFQKDTVGSYGLYPFQIYGYDYKGDKCTQECAEPYKPPAVDYPEEILKLYK